MSGDDRAGEFGPIYLLALQRIRDLWLDLEPFVDVIDESCTCPDWQQRSPEGGCKHLRRVDHEIKRGRVPRSDGQLPSASG